MSRFLIDTEKVKQSGEDIIQLASEFNEQITVLFSRISNMNKNTFEWVGKGSDEFIRKANIEKAQYIKVVEILNKYGKTLVDASTMYEDSAKKISEL